MTKGDGMTQAAIRIRMDAIARQLVASIAATPNDFDAREPLWMERESLRAKLTVRQEAA